jgi:translocation and assembly module TamA
MVLQEGRWVATGGNGLVDGSLELRQHLWGSFGGVLFLDGGNVTEASARPGEWRRVLELQKVQLAAGLGLRWATPFGPLRVDTAVRLPTDWSAGTAGGHRFPPVPGDSGHREPIVAVHVTIGEAF